MKPMYTVIDEPDRVYAVDETGIEICGAYQHRGHDYWSMYCTKLVTQRTGLTVPPHREHFYGLTGRTVARSWIELIAHLYSMATDSEYAA